MQLLKANDEKHIIMEIEEVMRIVSKTLHCDSPRVFTNYLSQAKAERARVNRAFVLAHEGTSPPITVERTPVKPDSDEEEQAEEAVKQEKENLPAELEQKAGDPEPCLCVRDVTCMLIELMRDQRTLDRKALVSTSGATRGASSCTTTSTPTPRTPRATMYTLSQHLTPALSEAFVPHTAGRARE
eukprot:3624030-Rhodomonas_salina.2